jgi:hypothetical protein
MGFILSLLGISSTTLIVGAIIAAIMGVISWIALAEFIKRHWKPIAVVAFLLVYGGGSYLAGKIKAEAACDEATLRLKIEQLERDIRVQKEADAIEDQEMTKLKTEKAADDAEILAYEAAVKAMRDELIKQGKDPDCDSLTQEEIDRLINHGKGKKP